jgi:UDP-N-acetylmuramoylalanine--D-glutamate ligase
MKTLIGGHNYQNAAAAVAIALSLGVEQPEIEFALQCFKGLPHRQELVRKLFGVNFINDSKATNFDAAERALSSFKSIYWIAGGLSKNDRITESFFKNLENVEHAFFIGSSENDFFDIFKDSAPCTKCSSLEIAVKRAASAACSEKKENPVVLLSPAAASFDQFESYEERGDQFKSIVGSLNLEKFSNLGITT